MTVRQATLADAPELARLRVQMFLDMGLAIPAELEAVTTVAYQERLQEKDFAAFVVGDGRLEACGVGWVERRLPRPTAFHARLGYIASMCTDPGHRRRGHAHAILTALLAWFDQVQVYDVHLHATLEGDPIYASFGFTPDTTARRLPSASFTEMWASTAASATDDTSDPSAATTSA